MLEVRERTGFHCTWKHTLAKPSCEQVLIKTNRSRQLCFAVADVRLTFAVNNACQWLQSKVSCCGLERTLKTSHPFILNSFFTKTARGFTNVSFSWHQCKQSVVLQGQQFLAERERFYNTRLITFWKAGTETFFFKVEAKRDKTHLLHVCVRVGRSWCIRVHIINS